MRIIITTTSGLGHFHPLVPLARALTEAGHDVAFACPYSLVARAEAAGFVAHAIVERIDPDPERAELGRRRASLPPGNEVNMLMLSDGFVRISARRGVRPLMELCARWKPDLIVREEFEFAGSIVADAMDIPQATVQVGFPMNWGALAGTPFQEAMDELRAEAGLGPDLTCERQSPFLTLSFDAPSFAAASNVADNTHFVRAPLFDQSVSGAGLPDWALHAEKPFVYATLGTEAAKIPGIFPGTYTILLDGMRELPGTHVLTVGAEGDPSVFGDLPPNLHVERYIPQSLLFPHLNMVLVHGGHNSVLAALYAGLPMVIVPLFADQMDNADRSVELGVAVRLDRATMTAADVRDAIRTVLDTEAYTASAKKIRAEIEALPGIDHAVELLERLARNRTRIVNNQ